jgi:hypothetical protein
MARPEEEEDAEDAEDGWDDARWDDEDDAMRWCDDEELDAVDDAEEEARDARASAETLFGNHAPSAPTSPSGPGRDGEKVNVKASTSGDGSSASAGHGGAAPKALSFGSVFTHAKAGMEDVDKRTRAEDCSTTRRSGHRTLKTS